MQSLILGADPGVTGYVAIFEPGPPPSLLHLWPLHAITLSDSRLVGPKGEIITKPLLAVVEAVHAFPFDSPLTAFRLGESFGRLLYILQKCSAALVKADPQAWQGWFCGVLPRINNVKPVHVTSSTKKRTIGTLERLKKAGLINYPEGIVAPAMDALGIGLYGVYKIYAGHNNNETGTPTLAPPEAGAGVFN